MFSIWENTSVTSLAALFITILFQSVIFNIPSETAKIRADWRQVPISKKW